jgi:hypothetical protein
VNDVLVGLRESVATNAHCSNVAMAYLFSCRQCEQIVLTTDGLRQDEWNAIRLHVRDCPRVPMPERARGAYGDLMRNFDVEETVRSQPSPSS